MYTDSGEIGYGLTGGQFLPHSVVTALENDFLDVVEGLDPRDTEMIHEKIWWELNQRSMTGVVSLALSALDIACWDIRGKMEGRTVAQLLGGAGIGHQFMLLWVSRYDMDQLVEAAILQVNSGIKG